MSELEGGAGLAAGHLLDYLNDHPRENGFFQGEDGSAQKGRPRGLLGSPAGQLLRKSKGCPATGDGSGWQRCGRLLPSGTTWWQLGASPRKAGTPAEKAASPAPATTAQQGKPVLFGPRT